MKTRAKLKDLPSDKPVAGRNDRFQEELTRTIDDSISDLSGKFDAILRRHKERAQTDVSA